MCSLVFLDGPTGLHWKFTVSLHLWRQKERNQTSRRGSYHRHPHAVGDRREGHSSDLPVRTVRVLLFKDSRGGEIKNLWVGDGVLWSTNRLCRDWAWLKERAGAGTVKAGRFLHLIFPALLSPSIRTRMCLLPWHSIYASWTDLNNDFCQ